MIHKPIPMHERSGTNGGGEYRYGFNGKELDVEGMGGGGSTYDYGFRIYNSSLGKFLSVDPLHKNYPWLTPYQFASNSPILCVDIDGKEGQSTQPNISGNQVQSLDLATFKIIIMESTKNGFEERVFYPIVSPIIFKKVIENVPLPGGGGLKLTGASSPKLGSAGLNMTQTQFTTNVSTGSIESDSDDLIADEFLQPNVVWETKTILVTKLDGDVYTETRETTLTVISLELNGEFEKALEPVGTYQVQTTQTTTYKLIDNEGNLSVLSNTSETKEIQNPNNFSPYLIGRVVGAIYKGKANSENVKKVIESLISRRKSKIEAK